MKYLHHLLEKKLNLSKNLLMISILTVTAFSFSEKLSTVSEYFNKRRLSQNNLQMNFGISILNPPHSLKNSFGKDRIVQLEYRKESRRKYTPPILLKLETRHHKNRPLQSLSLFSGIQFPKTHRKTPIYFGLSLGSRFNFHKRTKLSFLLQISSSFRLYQWTHSISSLLHINAYYDFSRPHWWRVPSSIALSTGFNVNI